ncbi:hypothetical protein GQ55_4G290500 [Panicum hallii var. hallii]|uniref:Uncharacterized protein n=1 Tax=Panicum hallii var. hallii TaxID=1504633 RepID=A0A2T7E1B5_9POAL|nr:hypothetical protein GQ55_4G290500 [Panicum hallii var. hallii]
MRDPPTNLSPPSLTCGPHTPSPTSFLPPFSPFSTMAELSPLTAGHNLLGRARLVVAFHREEHEARPQGRTSVACARGRAEPNGRRPQGWTQGGRRPQGWTQGGRRTGASVARQLAALGADARRPARGGERSPAAGVRRGGPQRPARAGASTGARTAAPRRLARRRGGRRGPRGGAA